MHPCYLSVPIINFRLKEIFTEEEESNIRLFVEQAQAGAELIWQDKQERLKFLIEKRRKEHEEKYKDTPLCVVNFIRPLSTRTVKTETVLE